MSKFIQIERSLFFIVSYTLIKIVAHNLEVRARVLIYLFLIIGKMILSIMISKLLNSSHFIMLSYCCYMFINLLSSLVHVIWETFETFTLLQSIKRYGTNSSTNPTSSQGKMSVMCFFYWQFSHTYSIKNYHEKYLFHLNWANACQFSYLSIFRCKHLQIFYYYRCLRQFHCQSIILILPLQSLRLVLPLFCLQSFLRQLLSL